MKKLTSKLILIGTLCLTKAFASAVFTSKKSMLCSPESMVVRPATEECTKATVKLFNNLNISSSGTSGINTQKDYLEYRKFIKRHFYA